MIAVRYHDSTKHHFNRFARALGYLDWATQPDPFRRYAGASVRHLPRTVLVEDVPYAALYEGDIPSRPVNHESIGEFLRCSMGLSAWKQYGSSRWALRVNPSSGNLHPTEAWIVHDGHVWHYAPREHALEDRCIFAAPDGCVGELSSRTLLVALTSITWREAWKYGERAFRYCQHDTGHAIGAMRLAAAMLGWRLRLLSHWSDAEIATLLGLDRDDFDDAERDEPECIAIVGDWDAETVAFDAGASALVDAAKNGRWAGRPNRLSSAHVEWPIIDEVARATRFSGNGGSRDGVAALVPSAFQTTGRTAQSLPGPAARDVIVGRRSALAFDPGGALTRGAWLAMLQRLEPFGSPWDAIGWPPQVHLVLFVHRVQGVTPGIYAYLRDPAALAEWQSSMRGDFLWERVSSDVSTGDEANLYLLVPIDCRRTANRLSCDQDIAEDGFFSLAMVARFEPSLRDRGEWFYRRLFWECGMIGQVLYLEAEAVGARATGIGCYYDDPVHELLGLSGREWQSLYHFSMGLPLEDRRLTTEPGYEWESQADVTDHRNDPSRSS